MDVSKMKNIIVLKNVSSNIVEEAIVVLKENKKVSVCKYSEENNKNNENSDDFIINQAENIVNNFVNKVEKKQGPTKKDYINLKIKYLKLKKINILLVGMLLITLLLSF